MPLVRRFDAAPISRLPSTRIQVAAGFFTLSGILTGAFVLARAAWMAIVGASAFSQILMVAWLAASAAGLFWTGRALRAQRRDGWRAGLATLALPLVTIAVSPTIPWLSFGVSVVGLALLWSVRPELVD